MSLKISLFSPFLSAYRENCRKQHVLITFIEEWKKQLEQLDSNEVGGGVFMDFWKHCVQINNICSGFEEIISRVPQGFMV